MAVEIFPGVYTQIFDNSYYINPVPGTVGFIAFASEKGPDNELYISAGPKDLITTFGKPDKAKYGQGLFVAYNFNTISSNLYVMRVLPNDASYSNLVMTYDNVANTLALTTRNNLYSKAAIETDIAAADTVLIFYPIGRGQWYNNIAVNMTPSQNVSGAYELDIYSVDENSQQYLYESFTVSLYKDDYDLDGETLFIEDVLERYSSVLRCVVDSDVVDEAETNGITDFSTPFVTITNLDGGSEGSLYDANGNLDWTVFETLLVNAYTGTIDERVIDTEFIYFSLVFDAGYPSNVKDAIRTLCEDLRGDCLGILDMGDNSTAASALATRTTTLTYNSFYVALYEPFSKIFNKFNGRYTWITPVYHMAKIFAKVDRDFELWYPPAGLNRAMVPDIKEMRYELRGGYKDQFILNQINPIMRFVQGYVVWNESTSYKRASALQDIHIMRLILWIKKIVSDQLRWFIWDFNDEKTWGAVKNVVNEFLTGIIDALDDFNVDVYASEYDKKRGILRVDIYITPKRAVKVIKVSIIVS